MAKICGFISDDVRPEAVDVTLQAMLGTMKHDDREHREFCFPFAGGGLAILQSNVLGISNLAWTTDRARCVALSGQIVDHDRGDGELGVRRWDGTGRPDSEFLLAALEKHGLDALPGLKGEFAAAYYDGPGRSLTIATDAQGFYPLYYYAGRGGLWFASEVKAILQVIEPWEQGQDWEAWADFFYIGHMMGQRTLVKGISMLDSGQWVRFRQGAVTSQKYHDFTQVGLIDPTEVSTEKIASLFTQAVARRVRKGIPNTVLLSGGFDSRFTLGALASLGAEIRAVSMAHDDEHRGLDGALAQRAAALLGIECELRPSRSGYYASGDWLNVYHILDGMVPNRNLFISQVYPELRTDMGMVWDGLALDLSFGGYHGYSTNDEVNLSRFIAEASTQRDILKSVLQPEIFAALDARFEERIRAEFEKIPESESRFILFLLQNRVRRRTAVNPYQAYASQVEAVTPTVDADFLGYLLSIPNGMKLGHKLYIQTLKEHFPKLLKTPVCSAGEIFFAMSDPGLIARHFDWKFLAKTQLAKYPVAYRFARKFQTDNSPLSENDLVTQKALKDADFDRPFYRSAALREAFAKYCQGATEHRRLFLSVYYLELWHSMFFDRNSSQLDVAPTRPA